MRSFKFLTDQQTSADMMNGGAHRRTFAAEKAGDGLIFTPLSVDAVM